MPVLPLLLAAMAQVTPSTPIIVTGHQWAPFISPMGEPFRAKTPTDDTLADWFYQADTNHDGVLTAAEMEADAARFFSRLDTNHDGQIDPDELANYEYEIAPDVQVNSRRRPAPGDPAPRAERHQPEATGFHGRSRRDERLEEDQLGLGGKLQGAARYGLLNMPEPVAAADTDFDRAITLTEFREAALRRFELLDTGHQGQIALSQLEAIRSAALASDRGRKRNSTVPDARIGNGVPHDN